MHTPLKLSRARGALRVAVVTETYPPEINGVARTVGLMVEALLERGHEVQLIRPRQGRERDPSPDQALRERLVAGFAIPFYRHLQIGLASPSMLHKEWSQWRPDLVHVVTEGPLGWAAVSAARRLAIPVCSDFHTNCRRVCPDGRAACREPGTGVAHEARSEKGRGSGLLGSRFR
jgi:glycosyltransferase involved in cell wall biosynthesis